MGIDANVTVHYPSWVVRQDLYYSRVEERMVSFGLTIPVYGPGK